MNKIIACISALTLLASTALANEIQVFTSNTMHIELDKNTKFENIFVGEYKKFIQEQESILSSYFKDKKSVGSQAAYAVAFGTGATAIRGGSSSDLKNIAGYGLAGAAIGLAGKLIYDSITADNEYVYLRSALNSKGQITFLQSHVVANYSLSNQEVEQLAQENQIKLLTN